VGRVESVVVVVSFVSLLSVFVFIVVFVGIIVRRVVWSFSRPARMLAFNASRSMRCGGSVIGGSVVFVVSVVSLFSVVVIVVCVVGIVVFVGIIVRKVAWSFNRPAQMLAFNASRSMRCGGSMIDRLGDGFAWVGSVSGSSGGRLVGVAAPSMEMWSLDVGAWFVSVFFMFLLLIV